MKRYACKLTDKDILILLKRGIYHVDAETGTVYSKFMKVIPSYNRESYHAGGNVICHFTSDYTSTVTIGGA